MKSFIRIINKVNSKGAEAKFINSIFKKQEEITEKKTGQGRDGDFQLYLAMSIAI